MQNFNQEDCVPLLIPIDQCLGLESHAIPGPSPYSLDPRHQGGGESSPPTHFLDPPST